MVDITDPTLPSYTNAVDVTVDSTEYGTVTDRVKVTDAGGGGTGHRRRRPLADHLADHLDPTDRRRRRPDHESTTSPTTSPTTLATSTTTSRRRLRPCRRRRPALAGRPDRPADQADRQPEPSTGEPAVHRRQRRADAGRRPCMLLGGGLVFAMAGRKPQTATDASTEARTARQPERGARSGAEPTPAGAGPPGSGMPPGPSRAARRLRRRAGRPGRAPAPRR